MHFNLREKIDDLVGRKNIFLSKYNNKPLCLYPLEAIV
jgi:hypothetical protein